MAPKRSHHHHKRRHDRVPVGDARVLLVVLKELKINNVADVIVNMFWVMSQFGLVEKMSKFSDEQLLVQFKDSQAAERAMGYLNTRELKCVGVNSDLWSCKFAIVPSSVSQLTFKKEDERNSDFTSLNESIRYGVEPKKLDFLWGEHCQGEGWLVPKQPDESDRGQIPANREGLPKGEVGVCVYMANLPPEITAEQLYRVCGQYGVVVAAKMLQKHSGKALLQFATKGDAEMARKKLDGVQMFGKKLVVKQSPHANAQHWNGLQTDDQPKLYSMEDSPPPEPVKDKMPPSRFVWSAGGGDEIENAILLNLVSFNAAQPVMKRHPNYTILEFGSPEHAFRCISLLNGVPCGLPGSSRNFSMGFNQEMVIPITASPIHLHDLRSATGPLPISTTSANQPLPFRVTGGHKETIHELLTRLDLNDYGYFEKLDSEGYERASDLGGSQPEKLEKLGIKAGHVRRMLNDVEKQYKHDVFVQHFDDDMQASRSQTAPPQHPSFNLLEQARHQEGRTHTAPLITKAVCIDPHYSRPMNHHVVQPVVPAPVKDGDVVMEDPQQRSMTCPTAVRSNGAGQDAIAFMAATEVCEEDMHPRTKTCPGGIASPALFAPVPDRSEDEAAQDASNASTDDNLLQRLNISQLSATSDPPPELMARTKTAPMTDEQFAALHKLSWSLFCSAPDFDDQWANGIRSQTLPGRPR